MVSVPTMAECRVGGDVFLDGTVDATVPVPAGRDGSRQWDVHRAGGSLVSRLRGTRVVDGCLERSRQPSANSRQWTDGALAWLGGGAGRCWCLDEVK